MRASGCKVRAVTRLFLPQAQLEEWALEEKADVKDSRLVVAGEPGQYPVVPAVHFLQLVSGEDTHKLVGKVKTEPFLQELGAEVLADSVLIGDTAYEVASGYVAEVDPQGHPPAERKSSSETDLLAAFLLNKMG